MSTKPPSDRMRVTDVPPTHLTPGTVGAPRKTRNEPDLRTAGVLPAFPHTHYAKRTQSTYAPRPKSTKRTQFHPQRTCGRPKNTKRTQFITLPPFPGTKNAKRTQSQPQRTCGGPNEPNSHIPGVPPTPIAAKRTQSWYRRHPPSQTVPQKMQNEPNPRWRAPRKPNRL